MTGSAKQSILRINTQSWIASSQALLAMTGLRRGQLLRREAAVESLALGRHLLEQFWRREARAVFFLELVAQRDAILGPPEVDIGQRAAGERGQAKNQNRADIGFAPIGAEVIL